MNRALRIIFSRYGIVVIILLLVLGAIALANPRKEAPLDGADSGTEDTTFDGGGSESLKEDDGIATEACEDDDCYAAVELPQEAVDRSVEFAEVWLNPNDYGPGGWYDSIVPYLTTEQADLMQGVDPVSVPAESITGEPTAEGPKVSIPLDTGTLTLTMTEGSNNFTENGWLVSAIDWEQS
ncbi:hypothetical protein K3N28_12755 [Glycomyces sp. TRM65418]|uniref:hypothetical protein n=1 Tax=Glycomyces sp. TRM65418 TaxID=2867006 RepID=UPI001CE6E162|nr:hypothetical protein [Glycomyces sp. TRM65418]MCC3763935.1 hypothetical protein [Glycomyces sp. TRM65418]QZD53636.1 hypothetical protein K3N28_12685 [Glycomyces sp. TRM65418]